MIYFFEIPNIEDSVELEQLPNSSTSSPDEIGMLKMMSGLRSEFQTITQLKKLQEIIQLGDSLSHYDKTLDSYLQTNVDLLTTVGLQPASQIKFQYSTFLSKQKTIQTEKNTNQQACGTEFIMVRYIYGFAYLVDCFESMQYVRDNVFSTFNDDQFDIAKLDQCLNDILFKIGTGSLRIRKAYRVMNDLLFFLIQKQEILAPELKATTVFSVKLLLEVFANSFYCESFRLRKDYVGLAGICKSSIDKLVQVFGRLFQIKSEIKDGIFHYLQISTNFFRSYALWAVLKNNEVLMKTQKYPEGQNFTIVSTQSRGACEELFKHCAEMAQLKCDDDYYDYGIRFSNLLFLETAQKLHFIYNGIHHNQSQLPNADEIIKNIVPANDYCETVWPL